MTPFFIPPYGMLKPCAIQDLIVLAAYGVVMIPITLLVARTLSARTQAHERCVQLT